MSHYPMNMQGLMQRQLRWRVDDRGQTHGGGIDGQTRRDFRTGQIDHGQSAKANLKESFWDAVGMIPVVGGIANIARGGIKMLGGLLTGRGYKIKEGFKNMVKGGMFMIPGYGTAIAGGFLAKDLIFDTGVHTLGAIRDQARFGGFQGKNMMAMGGMGYGNMGYGMGMAMMPGQMPYHSMPQMYGSPGYW